MSDIIENVIYPQLDSSLQLKLPPEDLRWELAAVNDNPSAVVEIARDSLGRLWVNADTSPIFNMNKTLTICRGLPGSGKTAWAIDRCLIDHYTFRVNRDEIRRQLGIVKWTPSKEKEVRRIRDEKIRQYLKDEYSVISDDTNLRSSTVAELRAIAEQYNAAVVINDSFLDVPIEECFKRDLLRCPQVGKDVIERMYYEYWEGMPKPVNEGHMTCIICDIDGTLAICPPGASHYERDFEQDLLNYPVSHLLFTESMVSSNRIKIVLLSGRDEVARDQTEKWLKHHLIPYDHLFMRPKGDRRKDYVVKRELYMEHIQSKYKVMYVLEDRPSIVRRWRAELGLSCFQVGPPMEF